jgi:hypothetical protein
VVVPFTIACGSCYHCGKHQYSACDNGLPADNQDIAQELYGQPMSGLFGYSHMTGGYAGGQAEYVRVPFSDVGPIVIPDGIEDEKVLFLSDILPTGWMAAENAADRARRHRRGVGLRPGRAVRGSVGVPDGRRARHRDRPFPAPARAGEEVRRGDDQLRGNATYEALMLMTGGIGPDAVIDAVGLEAHGFFVDNVSTRSRNRPFSAPIAPLDPPGDPCLPQGRPRLDAGGLWRVRRQIPARRLHGKGPDAQDRPDARPALHAGAAQRDHGGQDRYDLPDQPHPPLEDAPKGYKMFHDNQNEVTKVVLKPGLALAAE